MSKKSKKNSKKTSVAKSKSSLYNIKPLSISFWLPCLIFFGLALGLYYQCLNYDFILDDKIVITGNEYTKQGWEGIPKHLQADVFTGFFGEQKDLLVGGRYRPLSLIVFSIIYEYWQLDPMPYHLVNILFYAGVCCLIYALLTIFLKDRYSAQRWWFSIPLVATLLYLFHPIHIEAVANIKGLDEILTMFFSLTAWLIAVRTYRKKSWIASLFLGLTFFLALLAKENALTFLAVIPISFYVFAKPDRNDYLRLMLPLLAASVIYLIIRYQVLGYFLSPGKEVTDIMNNPFYGLSAAERFSTVMYTWLKYLILLIFPHPLVHDYYPYAIPIMELGDIRVLASILLHMILVGIAVWGSLKKRVIPFWLLYYFITFSIVSNLLFTVGTFMNERFIFIPSMAFSVILGILLVFYLHKWLANRTVAWSVSGFLVLAILSAYAIKAYDRIPDWETHLSLNQSAVEEYPNSARSSLFYATALFNEAMEENNRDEKMRILRDAETWVNRSIAIFPEMGNRRTRGYKYFNAYKMKAGIAAEIYKINKDLDYLLDQFLIVAVDKPHLNFLPEYLKYLHGRIQQNQLMINFYHELAFEELLQKKRNLRYALAYINLGLEFAPNSAILNFDKGRILLAMGQQAEGNQLIEKARQIDPSVIN